MQVIHLELRLCYATKTVKPPGAMKVRVADIFACREFIVCVQLT